MILLQAGLRGQQLLVWAERAPDTVRAALPGKTPPPPFAAPIAEVAAALTAAGATAHADPAFITVWLPTISRSPVPSSPLLGESPSGKSTLRGWQVPACRLAAASAIDLLAGL